MDAKEYDLSPEDIKQFEQRKSELEASVVSVTKQLFAKVQETVDGIKAAHRGHMAKLHKRKPEEPEGPPTSFGPPAGKLARSSGDAAAAPADGREGGTSAASGGGGSSSSSGPGHPQGGVLACVEDPPVDVRVRAKEILDSRMPEPPSKITPPAVI